MAKVSFAFKLYALQQEIVDTLDGRILNKLGNKYRFCIVAIGRQSGKSFLAKMTALERAINHNQHVMWVSPAIPAARQHWQELVALIEKAKLPDAKINQAAKEITFSGGGLISIRSAIEPDNLRGGTWDLVILDEAAFFRKGEYTFYSVVIPMVTASGGSILLLSTPAGRNWFWRVWKMGQSASEYYKSWRASSYESPYQDKKLLDELRTTMPEYKFLEEFMAEFLADSGGVFAGAEAAAVTPFSDYPSPNGSYVAGLDFGFNHDPTCFTVIDKITRQQVYGKRFFSRGTLDTIRILTELISTWQPEVTYLERNGLGTPFFSLLKDSLKGRKITEEDMSVLAPSDEEDEGTQREFETAWSGKVRGLFITNDLKRNMVESLAADIEYGRLKTLDDKSVYGEIQLSEMSTYQRERSQDGLNLKYNAEEGSYDDTISALYLANKGMPKPKPLNFNKKQDPDKKIKNPFRRGSVGRNHRKGFQ